jgi:hypothetical protein
MRPFARVKGCRTGPPGGNLNVAFTGSSIFIPAPMRPVAREHWILELGISLEFGFWDLGFHEAGLSL